MSSSHDSSCEIVVVGGGVVGLSVAEQIKRRGRSVLCSEQGAPGQGQSAGQTRIFRHAHPDPLMTTLALRARRAWRDLEERVGGALVGSEGVAIVGAADDVADRLAALGVAIELMDDWDLRSRLPMGAKGNVPKGAVLDVDAGAIRVDDAINGLCAQLGKSLVQARVLGLTERAAGVDVMTTEGVISCEEVVIAAGTETFALASNLGLTVPQERLWHVRVAFSVQDGFRLPCMLDRTGLYGEMAYASPFPDGSVYAIGLSGQYNSLSVQEGAPVPSADEVAALERRIIRYAEAALPQVLKTKVSTRLCVSTPLLLDDDAISIWNQGRVKVIAGGNMFKFAPLLGVVFADSLDGEALPEVLVPDAAGA